MLEANEEAVKKQLAWWNENKDKPLEERLEALKKYFPEI